MHRRISTLGAWRVRAPGLEIEFVLHTHGLLEEGGVGGVRGVGERGRGWGGRGVGVGGGGGGGEG